MPKLLSPAEVAVLIHVSTTSLARWRGHKEGPLWCRVGRRIYYRSSDVDDWLIRTRPQLRPDLFAEENIGLETARREAFSRAEEHLLRAHRERVQDGHNPAYTTTFKSY